MGNRAIYNIIENDKNNYFFAHWGANALSPLLRLSQAMELQKQLLNNPSIVHAFEHLDHDGKYIYPRKPDADMFCSKIDDITVIKYQKSYAQKSEIEMRITLDVVGNNCLLEYNNNCPWYSSMSNYSIPIDVGLNNVKKLLNIAEKKGIDSFDDLLYLYHKSTGLDKPLDIARKIQENDKYWQSDEAEEHRKIYKELFGVHQQEELKVKEEVIMKPENAKSVKYQIVEAAGQTALFTDLRIDRDTVPNGYYCYDLRHGDDEGIAETIENRVKVNYFGTVLCQSPYDFEENSFIALEDGIDFLVDGEVSLKDLEQNSMESFIPKHEENIKVLIIEPEKRPYISEIENHFKSMQAVVGGMFECVVLDKDAHLFCNESGKLIGLPGNRKINDDIIAGTFLICGNDRYGNSISLTDEQINTYSSLFAEPEYYTNEQVQSDIHYEIISCSNKDKLLKMMFGSNINNDDEEIDLEP